MIWTDRERGGISASNATYIYIYIYIYIYVVIVIIVGNGSDDSSSNLVRGNGINSSIFSLTCIK